MVINSKISTIIIEDDIDAQNYLSNIITKNFNTIDITGSATSIKDAITLIKKERPELVFMDIELRDGSAFEIFKTIDSHDFEVIFVTGFGHFIQKAIDHYALSYILKPIDETKLISAVNRYLSMRERLFTKSKLQLLSDYISEKDPKLLLHVGDQHISIRLDTIIKCEADGNYTHFYLLDKSRYLASKNLKYYETLLTERGFFKAHRSALINTAFIQSIFKKETIILSNGDTIHVSVRNKSKLTELINALS